MKKLFIYLFIIFFAIYLIFLFLRFKENKSYIEKGNKIVNKIYEYKTIHKKLPNKLSDIYLDLEMGEGPYYKKMSDSIFIVFYNIGFDDKIIFKSNLNKWE